MLTRIVFPIVLVSTFAGQAAVAAEVRVRGVLVTLIDDINVPAREAGVIAKMNVKVGSMVKAGEELARVNDQRSRLTMKKSEVERRIAAERAGNDAKVRFARKTKDVAVAELKRAEDSVRRFPNSISDSQMDSLRLSVARSDAEIELEKQERRIAAMTEQLKGVEVETARDDVARRQILSTINGMVVDVYHKAGEWVEPGEKVFRVVRTDTLRVKGFIKAAQADNRLKGRPVRVMLDGLKSPVYGKVTFVSPLIDPDNGEVAVWAEVPNTGGNLRPGLRGEMTIGERPER